MQSVRTLICWFRIDWWTWMHLVSGRDRPIARLTAFGVNCTVAKTRTSRGRPALFHLLHASILERREILVFFRWKKNAAITVRDDDGRWHIRHLMDPCCNGDGLKMQTSAHSGMSRIPEVHLATSMAAAIQNVYFVLHSPRRMTTKWTCPLLPSG
jgi:hypothetical protein